jgi:GntR family transcriptional regulator / MocR family aminotransferase
MSESQTNLAWDTLLDLGEGRAGPLHARLAGALREAIRGGRLPSGSALPPSRTLAEDLGCSRWVVTEAYAQLAAEGYLDARVGAGTRVRALGQAAAGRPPRRDPPAWVPRIDLAPGLPDLRAFPLGRWVQALRSVASTVPYAELGYPDPAGHPRLRRVLAEYLARVRGAQVDPADVTVCRGVADGTGRVCRALRAAGIGAVAVEDPGWHRLREAAAGAGLRLVPTRVDGQGLRVGDLGGDPAVRAVIVSPTHQFPTGVVLSAQRRGALLAWARHVDGVVLEDDYDAEFRYDRRPVGTMQGTDPSRVVLLGSLSKTLSPALGIGWVVTPPAWTRPLRAATGQPAWPPTLDQLAFAAFLQAGAYDRHLRAARRRYRRRRDRLVGALAERLPEARLLGVAAGLHLLVHLDGAVDCAAVVDRAAAAGMRVANLDTYRCRPDAGPGLVLGYGNLADGQVEEAVALLAATAAASRRRVGLGGRCVALPDRPIRLSGPPAAPAGPA